MVSLSFVMLSGQTRLLLPISLILLVIFNSIFFISSSSGHHHHHLQRRTRQVAGNLDAALRNPSFVRFQLACLLDRSPCDRIGQRIKSLLPEMVATGHCSQCSPQEIGQAGKVMLFIQEHYPMEYDLLEKKFVADSELQEEPNFD